MIGFYYALFEYSVMMCRQAGVKCDSEPLGKKKKQEE